MVPYVLLYVNTYAPLSWRQGSRMAVVTARELRDLSTENWLRVDARANRHSLMNHQITPAKSTATSAKAAWF